MSLEPTLAQQELLAYSFERPRSRMSPREAIAAVLVGGGFIAAMVGLWWLLPPGDFPVLPALMCLLVLVAAIRVKFQTPFGYTVPTQLAFVPLLFAVPLATVPVLVAVGFMLACLPEVLKRTAPPGKLAWAVGNSWFAIGPVLVFALANTQPRDAGPGLLLAALAAQFLVDFAASAVTYGVEIGESLASQLRDTWVYGIDAALSVIGLIVAADMHSTPTAVLGILPLLGILSLFARERHHRLEGWLELQNAYRGTALVLGEVVEADDGYTGEHCKSVEALAVAVAERLELSAERRRNLEFSALLHDVGKIVIPKEIINKPGKLDPEEWELVKTHTIAGQRMLAQIGGFMEEVGRIVRAHHERWDGRGYPNGLAGEQIPLEARIIACCDSWNAMRTDRAYRQALSHEVALAELVGNSGTQFDPMVVDALIEIVSPHAGQPVPEMAIGEEPLRDERAAA